MLANFHGTLS